MIRELELGESVNEALADSEVSMHNHYGTDTVYALTLLEDPDVDPDWDGEPMGCPLCDEEVSYHVCDECGDSFQTEEGMNGHKSAHSEEE